MKNVIIIIVMFVQVFFCRIVFSQTDLEYSNIDSCGNIISGKDYITDDEIINVFNINYFNIQNLDIKTIQNLPLQLISDKVKDLSRIPFFQEGNSEDSDLYFIGKLAVKNIKFKPYIFAELTNFYGSSYFLVNYYDNKVVSLIVLASDCINVFFREFSVETNSKMTILYDGSIKITSENIYKYQNDLNSRIEFIIDDQGFLNCKEIK